MANDSDTAGEQNAQLTSEGGAGQGKRKGLRLSVSSFKKKKRRTSEGSFEATFAKACRAVGYTTWHISSRERGWPDRYLGAGIWVELKSLEHFGESHELKPEQIAKLNELTAGGDRCFYCAKWQDSFVLVPWDKFKRVNKKPLNCERFHYRTQKDIEEAIKWVIKQ